MRRQRVIQVNRFFAFAAVVVVAFLLLGDPSMWIVLAPIWVSSWIFMQIALQHYSSGANSAGFEDDQAGISYLVEALRAAEVSDELHKKNLRMQSLALMPATTIQPVTLTSAMRP